VLGEVGVVLDVESSRAEDRGEAACTDPGVDPTTQAGAIWARIAIMVHSTTSLSGSETTKASLTIVPALWSM
jgi:hypothetical protein